MSAPILQTVADVGLALVDLAALWGRRPAELRDEAALSPWGFVARLLGVAPLLVERQPIRPVPGARSFASGREVTPLHTDSQLFLGVPAALQILVCVTAARGGESVFVDGARVLERIDRDAPALGLALFDEPRTQRFYFGEVNGPTIALRGGHLAWTLAPPRTDDDRIGRELAPFVERAAREDAWVRALAPGEAIIASNHRLLHGRRAFEGDRELVRLLVWLDAPIRAELRHIARAREVAPCPPPAVMTKLRAVLALVRGVPPARVAAESQVEEAALYEWRERFVRGGIEALAGLP